MPLKLISFVMLGTCVLSVVAATSVAAQDKKRAPGTYAHFVTNHGEFTVDLRDGPGPYAVEWLNVYSGKTVRGKPVRGGGKTIFSTPFGGPAVLYLKSGGA